MYRQSQDQRIQQRGQGKIQHLSLNISKSTVHFENRQSMTQLQTKQDMTIYLTWQIGQREHKISFAAQGNFGGSTIAHSSKNPSTIKLVNSIQLSLFRFHLISFSHFI